MAVRRWCRWHPIGATPPCVCSTPYLDRLINLTVPICFPHHYFLYFLVCLFFVCLFCFFLFSLETTRKLPFFFPPLGGILPRPPPPTPSSDRRGNSTSPHRSQRRFVCKSSALRVINIINTSIYIYIHVSRRSGGFCSFYHTSDPYGMGETKQWG